MGCESIEAIMRTGDWAAAAHACESALQLQPSNPKMWGYLGLCEFRLCEYAKAEVALRKATILDPSYHDAGVKHAQCLDKLRRYEEAYQVAKEWLVKRPNDNTLRGLVEFLTPMVHGEAQGWERTMHLSHRVVLAREE